VPLQQEEEEPPAAALRTLAPSSRFSELSSQFAVRISRGLLSKPSSPVSVSRFFWSKEERGGGGDWHESGKTAKLRTENEMLLLKLAKFYVRTFYIEMRP